jgi:hypothetical protein
MRKIKYCGNCNPDVHPRQVRQALDRLAAACGSDIVVAVNGCSRVCVSKGFVRDVPENAIIVNARDLVTGGAGRKNIEDLIP